MNMKAKVIQFRRGLKRIHERHYILDIGAKSRDEASKFVGKEVIWTSPAGKQIKGKISSAHGNKGNACTAGKGLSRTPKKNRPDREEARQDRGENIQR